jgi:hypothetical protein
MQKQRELEIGIIAKESLSLLSMRLCTSMIVNNRKKNWVLIWVGWPLEQYSKSFARYCKL